MKVIAEFFPQAWMRDQAIDVDAPGPRGWDATTFASQHLEYVKRMLARKPDGYEVLDYDDVFHQDPDSPEWTRNWQGPFSIYLTIDDVSEKSLFQFEARASDDEVKTDLELTCTECGEVLCDIEDGDNIGTLVSVVNDHTCKPESEDTWMCPGCHRKIEPSDVRRHASECDEYDGKAGY